jgi:translation initiation factor IF-2
MRVYEIAKEIGIPNKDLIAKIRALGLEVNNHMSSLDADDVARIKRSLEKEKASVTAPAQTQKLSSGTVLRRRSSGDKAEGDAPAPSSGSAATAAPTPVVRRRVADGSGPETAPVHVHPERPANIPVPPPLVRRREPEPVVETKPEPVVAAVEPRSIPAPVVAEPPKAVVVEPPPARVEAPVVVAPVVPVAPKEPEAPPPVVAKPEPVPEVVAKPVVEEPRPVPPKPEPAPTPVQPASTNNNSVESRPPVAAQAAPVTPAVASEPAQAPRPRVILNAPQVMRREEPRPAPVAARSIQQEPPASTPLPPRNRHSQPQSNGPEVTYTRPGPRTVEEVAGGARSRFEMELERARARTAERPPTEAPPIAEAQQQPVEAPVAPPRDPSRPAVGTVISLPPRIKITERTPMGGRPSTNPSAPQPANAIRGRFAQQQQRGGRPGGPGGRPGQNDFGRKKLPFSPSRGKGAHRCAPPRPSTSASSASRTRSPWPTSRAAWASRLPRC